MIRAVTFDMDYTLRQIQPFPPHLRFIELCEEAGIPLSEDQAIAGTRARKRFVEWLKAGGSTPDASHAYARVGLEAAGVTGDLDELAEALRDASRRRSAPSELDPDVPEVLDQLKARGFALGIVSNWGTDVAKGAADYGIAHYFVCMIDALSAGVTKPDPAIYLMACDRMGVPPKDCVHVGDSPWDDVGVARAVSATPVLYDPMEDLDAGCPRIHRLLDLLPLLDQLARESALGG